MPDTQDIVQKLWNLCHVLRDDGITYHQYVTELTYLLFLKMAEETEREGQLADGFRWRDLKGRTGAGQLQFYRELLVHLGGHGPGRVQAIYANASTALRQPRNLKKLIDSIDELDWYSARREGLGELYEGLLEKNATEQKSGAGQYFTPRPLIEAIVSCVKPQAGEIIQDPAAGTGGFLIVADRQIKEQTDDLFRLSEREQRFQREEAFWAMELVPEAQRLLLMNALLHDIDGHLLLGDTLSAEGQGLPAADLILTNPPFGTKRGGGAPSRDDFTFPTSNKQFAFLQHVYRALKPGGRAAVIVPDNVLFEEGLGARIRDDLMEKTRLHTILRLPTGIFYAQGIKTNVLFFTRGEGDVENTSEVWIFDLRTNMPTFGKRAPLSRAHFAEFEDAFGNDPHGSADRVDTGASGRFRRFSREEIRVRGDNLDITWLRDEDSSREEHVYEPEVVAAQITLQLQHAVSSMQELASVLGSTASELSPSLGGLTGPMQSVPTLLDQFRRALLAAAFRGRLTANWRAKNLPEPITDTLIVMPPPSQPRGGQGPTSRVIPGVAGMSVGNPGTALPDGWAWVPLLRVARQETGHTPSRGVAEYWDGDIPWIGIRDAAEHHGRVIHDTLQHVSEVGLANSSARLLPRGTVCLSRTASVGYVVLMGREMATSQDFATWTCTPALDPEYLALALLSEGDQLLRFGKGSTHTTIYFPEIRALHVALAPVQEQLEIVRQVRAAFTKIDTVAAAVRGMSGDVAINTTTHPVTAQLQS